MTATAQAVRERPILFSGPMVRAIMVLGAVPPGSLVLDPFMGSGTTLQAAKDLGFRAVGIDCDERYCEMAAERCRQETLGLSA